MEQQSLSQKLTGWLQGLLPTSWQSGTPAPALAVTDGYDAGESDFPDADIDPALAAQLDAVISACYMGGCTLQSDYARRNSQVFAVAASRGFITTLTPDGTYGRRWRPTYNGFLWIQSGKHSDV